MLKFIQQLKTVHVQKIQQLDEGSDEATSVKSELSAIELAEACLLKLQLQKQHIDYPSQIAVLGPTQAGKSTLVNSLTGTESAGTSALAGYTVHAQGFCVGSPDIELWPKIIFEGFESVEHSSLNHSNFEQYSISQIESTALDSVSPCVLWDTPDFDSVKSLSYHSAVLRTIALSDVVVLVLSRDKYGDKSVWDLLKLIAPLNIPMLVCINKLDAGSESLILDSFNERYQKVKDKAITEVIGLPFVRGLGKEGQTLPDSAYEIMHQKLNDLAQKAQRQQQAVNIYAFIEQHWQPWTGPVSDEHKAMQKWQKMIESALKNATKNYKRDYLDHPDKYDTFKRTLAQLLMLLEIPAIAEPLMKFRNVITWPARKLFDYGKSYANGDDNDVVENAASMEQSVLNNSCDHVLISLINKLDEQEAKDESLGHWWKLMRQQLHSQRESIKLEFEENVSIYQNEFQLEVEEAAKELYAKLEKQPATLNGLRAARTTADAAGLVVAVQAGGLGMHDLLLAPVMLSITSMLTESALGNYLKSLKARLRIQQLEAVDDRLYRGYLNTTLASLLKQDDSGDIVLISEKALSDATETLRTQRA